MFSESSVAGFAMDVVLCMLYGSRGFWGEVKSFVWLPDVHLTFMLIYIYMYP